MNENHKKISTRKLSLGKETLRLLRDSDLASVAGGQLPETRETQCTETDCGGSAPSDLTIC